jgi:N-acetylglutamate synthase-like GNAT family acetyltransferase
VLPGKGTYARLVGVKGQRLFVRRTETADEETLSDFYRSESFDATDPIGSEGVLAKLVGQLVAHLAWNIERDRAVITHVYVADALRGRRVGLVLVRDAIAIARENGVKQIRVSGACPVRDFFLRTGFADEGQELVMEVS